MTKEPKCEKIMVNGTPVLARLMDPLTPEDRRVLEEFAEMLRSRTVVRIDRKRRRSTP